MIKMIHQLIIFSGEDRKQLFKGMFFQLLYSILEAMPVLTILIAIQFMLQEKRPYRSVLATIVVILLISFIGRMMTHYYANKISSLTSFKVCAKQRLSLGERLKQLPMGFFSSTHLGEMTQIITSDIDEIQAIATPLITQILVGIIHAVVITLFLLSIHWTLALIALVSIVLGLTFNIYIQKEMKRVSRVKQTVASQLSDTILEYIKGIAVVKSYGLGDRLFARVEQSIEDSAHQNLGFEKRFTVLSSIYRFIFKLSAAGIIFAAASLYLQNAISIEYAITAMIVSFVAFTMIEEMGASTALLEMMNEHLEKVRSLEKIEPMEWGDKAQDVVSESITFEQVAFSYDDKPLLQDISFHIPQGSKTAIVGPSGGGKSTVCRLMARFWDVDQGQVLLGGNNIKTFSSEALMSHFSIVFQNVYLFRGTIIDNIRFGKPDASFEEVVEASKQAGCHAFISLLPNGYETLVEEGGGSLSGGERQRISIARAIIKSAPIIILDEATASVDPENEWLIQRAIEHLTKGKTVISIAHRLSTIKDANQILVIDQGGIAESGTHEALMLNQSKYYEFVKIREEAENWEM